MQKRAKIGGQNRGKQPGRKRPFDQEHVQLIRATLKARGETKKLALFETGLCTMLRAGDLLRLTVSDVQYNGKFNDSFEIIQEKTGERVTLTLSAACKEALGKYITEFEMRPAESLWPMSRMRYSQIVKEWAVIAGLDPQFYSTHSMRRTTAAHVYKQTNNYAAVRHLLGHTNLMHTAAYLGVEEDDAHALKKLHEM